MAFQKGDVLLVPFPFTDLSAVKVRPAVVVSSESYHNSEPDLILGALTSNIAAATGPFDYVLADWRAAGLHYATAFKPIIVTLEPTRIVHKIGRLSATDLAKIDQRLKLALNF